QRERALYAHAIAGTANGKRFARAAVAAGNDHAFERLQALAGTFDDLHMHAHGIAHHELRQILAQLGLLNGANDLIHGENSPSLWTFVPGLQTEDRPITQPLVYHR